MRAMKILTFGAITLFTATVSNAAMVSFDEWKNTSNIPSIPNNGNTGTTSVVFTLIQDDITFELTAQTAPGNVFAGKAGTNSPDTYPLAVIGGSKNYLIDQGTDEAATTDDESLQLSLNVSGSGVSSLASIKIAGVTLRYFAAQDKGEFTDGTNTINVLGNTGSGGVPMVAYDGVASDTHLLLEEGGTSLTPLSLVNVGGAGDGSWLLGVTARNLEAGKESSFQITSLDIEYTLIPEPASFAMIGLGGVLMISRRKK
ncbi:PEP-CTERM sorting domain-containing protein [Planctomycetota bacterium]|nr:PEP-CTERM sorting domain-containing protein [Planctomycetota bacterium]